MVKVKRGLGLLVVAVLALIVSAVASSADDSGTADTIAELAWLAVVGFGLVGLVLIAWGLLRE